MKNTLVYLFIKIKPVITMSATIALISGVSIFSPNARSEGTCAIGYITQMEFYFNSSEDGGLTFPLFGFSVWGPGDFYSPSQDFHKGSPINGKPVTTMYVTLDADSYNRFLQVITLAKMAFGLRLPTRVYNYDSTDHQCAGYPDKFTFTICTTVADCNYPNNQ